MAQSVAQAAVNRKDSGSSPDGGAMDQYEACKILGIASSATPDQVKTAYRELAKKYHPDVCKLPGANEKFVKINQAYDYLCKNPLLPASSGRNTRAPFGSAGSYGWGAGSGPRAYAEFIDDILKGNFRDYSREYTEHNTTLHLKLDGFPDGTAERILAILEEHGIPIKEFTIDRSL